MDVTSLLVSAEPTSVASLPADLVLHVDLVVQARPDEDVEAATLVAWVLGPDGTPVSPSGTDRAARFPLRFAAPSRSHPDAARLSGVVLELPFAALDAGTHRLVVHAVAGTGGAAAVERDVPFAVVVADPDVEVVLPSPARIPGQGLASLLARTGR